jgi:O-antigen/teichoic acid export membrane protein
VTETLPVLHPIPRRRIARSLRFNFSWTLAGNVAYGGCQWLMLVSIARLGDPRMVGTYSLAQAVTAPVILFGNLQLRAIQATDSAERFRFGHYLALRYLTTAASFASLAVWAFFAGYRAETLAVILVVALAKSMESLSDIYFGLLQHREEMSRIAKSMMTKGLLSLGALAGTLYLTRRLVFAAAAMMLAWSLVFTGYDSRAPRFCAPCDSGPVWEWRTLARLARQSLPLGVTMMLISLNGNLPRYFMEHYQGTRRLGLFSALAAIQTAGMLVVMALGNAALPRLARHYHEADWLGFRNTIVRFLAVSMGLGALTVMPAIVAGDTLIAMIFGREYAGQNRTFVWLTIAAAVSYCASVFGYAATASRRIALQPVIYAVVAAIMALGCYYFIPRYGGLGAAFSMCAASAIGGLLYLFSFADTARELRGLAARRKAARCAVA